MAAEWRWPWLIGREQFGRRLLAQQRVDVLQCLRNSRSNSAVLAAGMIVAEPPEPVAPLGDVQFFPGAAQLLGRLARRAWPRATRCCARLEQQVPGPVALGMADPDAEIVADPTAGEQVADLVGGRMLARDSRCTRTGLILRMRRPRGGTSRAGNRRRRWDSIPSSFRRRE